MATYTPNSWGRTRRPKGVKERLPPGGIKETPTLVTVVASSNLKPELNGTNEGENGYSTENQRYLHVLVKDNSGVKTIDIYAFNYAFGEWSPIFLNLGNAAFQRVQAASGTGGAVQEYVFEIAGIDRVAFVQTASGSPTVVRAACSTF
tara:strand:+ start:1660 stop:2103 length:444 start_codon:yes stop_codon:yes gene_type:complete